MDYDSTALPAELRRHSGFVEEKYKEPPGLSRANVVRKPLTTVPGYGTLKSGEKGYFVKAVLTGTCYDAWVVFCPGCGLTLGLSVSPSAGETVYVVPIRGTIEKGLAAFVSRVVDEAEEVGAAAVIFEIDTPGGRWMRH